MELRDGEGASSGTTDPADDIVADIIQRVIQRWHDAPTNDLLALEVEVRRDWGGDRPYIAKVGEAGRVERSQREQAIRVEYERGERVGFLSRKWNLSIRRIQQIVKG